MKPTRLLIAAAMLLLPSAALAAPGIVTTSVSLRAGPGEGFPAVDRIPGGARVNIHGCLRGDAWCDVSWTDARGWVSSDYLQWLYRNHYVYLSDYYDDLDVPVVPFALGSYWSTYYSGRPFFHRRGYYDRYWRSHEAAAMRTPARIARARAGRGNAAVIEGRGRGAEARTTIESRNRAAFAREQDRVRGAEAGRIRGAETGRIRGAEAGRIRGAEAGRIRGAEAGRIRGAEAARIGGAERGRVAGVRGGEQRGRFAAGPAARPAPTARMAQPNVSHGAPMSAHAQMPAPRAAAPAAVPHVGGGGGAAHIGGGAAAHVGGGAPGGGGPGRHH